MRDTTLICGLGSAHGDDQIGWQVAEHLATTMTQRGVRIRVARSPAELLDWLAGIDRLIVCDACENLGSPGTVHCWRWPDVPRGVLRSLGTHDLGLAAVLALAEQLCLLPAEVVIWAAEVAACVPAAPPSCNMEDVVTRIVDAISAVCCKA